MMSNGGSTRIFLQTWFSLKIDELVLTLDSLPLRFLAFFQCSSLHRSV